MTTPRHAPQPPTSQRDDDRRRWALVAVGVLLAATFASAAVLRTSSATFTASTENTGNSVRTTTVTLTTGVEQALFDVTELEPGDAVTRCVEVTYEGTLRSPAPVRVFSRGFLDESGLSEHLTLEIAQGAEGTTCAGGGPSTVLGRSTLAAFDAQRTDHATGLGTWVPQGRTDTRAFRVTFALDRDTPPEFSGTQIEGLAFGWEVTS